MKAKSFIAALAIAAAALSPSLASASSMVYSYAENDELYRWGLKVAQTYDIAVNFNGAAFEGKQIKTITVPILSSETIGDYQIWLSSELKLTTDAAGKKVNDPDIMSAEVTPVYEAGSEYGYISYTLPETYQIPAAGVYIGYTFTVSKITSDNDRYPVLVTPPGKEGALYVHSSKTYRVWQDRSTEIGAVSPIAVTLEGDFSANAVGLNEKADFFAQAGDKTVRPTQILNLGTEGVASVGYELTIDGVVSTGAYELPEPIPGIYNRKGSINVEYPALDEGIHDYTLKITTVNGQSNGQAAQMSGKINALSILPVKRPLMEEYTGFWCGWCPRGWVAMEKMNEFHPDFVCISYHDKDPLTIQYPAMIDGFPQAVMDRKYKVDPYSGPSDKEFGINEFWEALAAQFAPAEITLKATYNEDGTKVSVTSDVCWIQDPGEGEYRVEYVLVGDGLHSMEWLQSNYYSSYSAAQGGLYLEDFCKGGKYGFPSVPDLVYNDVALLTSGLVGVEGSITTTELNAHNEYTYTFDLADNVFCKSASKLRVVAYIIQSTANPYGIVVNSNKTEIGNSSGINDILASDAEVVSEKYYDLSGREVINPNAGIYIKSVKLSDGQIRTTKVAK